MGWGYAIIEFNYTNLACVSLTLNDASTPNTPLVSDTEADALSITEHHNGKITTEI